MKNLNEIYGTVLNLVEEIPFGNSDAQNRLVIVDKEATPCRAYRHSALRIMNRLEALKECYYGMRKREIELKILERDRDNERDELKRELIDLEIEQKRSGDAYTKKLIKDAIAEIESLYPVLQSMGRVTRKQFEAEEIEHYQKKHGQALAFKEDLFERIQLTPRAGAALPDLAGLIGEIAEIIKN